MGGDAIAVKLPLQPIQFYLSVFAARFHEQTDVTSSRLVGHKNRLLDALEIIQSVWLSDVFGAADDVKNRRVELGQIVFREGW